MTNLKPCPFCGDSVNITYMSFENVFAIWHNNKVCSLIEPQYISGEDAKSLSEARDIWNKRSDKGESE